MSIPEKFHQPEKNYMPAVLKKYSKDWRIEYYALNCMATNGDVPL